MTEWKTYKIGDLCDTISDTYKGCADEVVLINTSDVLEGKCLNHTKEPNRNLKGQFKKTFKKYDILYSEIRPANKRFAYIDFDATNYIASTKLMVLRHNEKIEPLYFYYILQSQSIIDELQMLAESRSGTFPQITFAELSRLEVKLPNREVQRQILGILSAIDDKIENNRRINANLELQAQALYKQWFVDNRSDDWEEKLLSEIAEFVGGYSYKGNELVESSSTAMATIKNFERKGGFKVEGFKGIVASSKLKAEQHAELFDILVAHTDLTQNADVIGNAEILLTFGGYTDIIFSMDLVKVLPKSNFPYKYLLAALLKNPYFKAHCLGYVNGTTVLHMSKKALPEYVVACPPNSEAEKMDRAFKVYYHKMAEILQENETLATLRDTLLPKLMNGEIKL
ncbi:MAG: restriction endonuclease subunit S [Alistipes sp.]|nr:restriction endonuclease subunit S [Alistipes sp.]